MDTKMVKIYPLWGQMLKTKPFMGTQMKKTVPFMGTKIVKIISCVGTNAENVPFTVTGS